MLRWCIRMLDGETGSTPPRAFAELRGAIGLSVGSGAAPVLADSLELAVAADRGGMDLLTAGDTGSETFSLLGAIAARTDQLTLMSGVAQWTRTPVTMASAARTLQNLSDGRYWLGLGPMPRAWAEDEHGIPHAPVLGRMRDYVAATRAALAATEQRPTAHDGPYFRTVGYTGRPLTPERAVPIQLAASRARMTELAAEIADGVMLNAIQPLGWLAGEGADAIARGLQRGERPRDRFAVGLYRFVGIDDDRDAAYDHARRAVAFYFAIPYFRALLEPYGFTRELDTGEAALRRGDAEAQIAAVSDELVDAVALAGTPDEVVAKLRRVQEHADYVVLSATHGQSREDAFEQTLRLIATFGPVSRRTTRSSHPSGPSG
jgi:alkanesulfonate monooxygenase SsuD/methylene tetrahydromethanopterin reductase-like flavin-dependent oxidoreductase (luciferase family)